MNLHANAALTVKQRREVKQLYEQGQSVRALAERFGVHETTIRRWIKRESPLDKSSAPHQPHTVVTEAYREAVLAYRAEHPGAGPIRIAQALSVTHPQAHRGTVLRILQAAGLTHPQGKKSAQSGNCLSDAIECRWMSNNCPPSPGTRASSTKSH